jgi:integrase
MSYRTEEAYSAWGARFAAWFGGRSPERVGELDIRGFLDYLARESRVSSSTQRQALNAVVFLLREVMGRALGDFSDYRRARVRAQLPTVLTRDEVHRLLSALEGTHRLMAQVMYGCGLRLMELIRLRIQDVGVARP